MEFFDCSFTSLVYRDSLGYTLACIDLLWLVVIYCGLYWYSVACTDMLWAISVYCGLYLHTRVLSLVLYWYPSFFPPFFFFFFLSCIGIQCSVLIYSGLQWYTVAWTSIPYYLYWHTGVYTSILWSVPSTVHCSGYCGLCWYAFPPLAYCVSFSGLLYKDLFSIWYIYNNNNK